MLNDESALTLFGKHVILYVDSYKTYMNRVIPMWHIVDIIDTPKKHRTTWKWTFLNVGIFVVIVLVGIICELKEENSMANKCFKSSFQNLDMSQIRDIYIRSPYDPTEITTMTEKESANLIEFMKKVEIGEKIPYQGNLDNHIGAFLIIFTDKSTLGFGANPSFYSIFIKSPAMYEVKAADYAITSVIVTFYNITAEKYYGPPPGRR